MGVNDSFQCHIQMSWYSITHYQSVLQIQVNHLLAVPVLSLWQAFFRFFLILTTIWPHILIPNSCFASYSKAFMWQTFQSRNSVSGRLFLQHNMLIVSKQHSPLPQALGLIWIKCPSLGCSLRDLPWARLASAPAPTPSPHISITQPHPPCPIHHPDRPAWHIGPS